MRAINTQKIPEYIGSSPRYLHAIGGGSSCCLGYPYGFLHVTNVDVGGMPETAGSYQSVSVKIAMKTE